MAGSRVLVLLRALMVPVGAYGSDASALILGVSGAVLLGQDLLAEHFHERGLNGLHLDLLGCIYLLLVLQHGI